MGYQTCHMLKMEPEEPKVWDWIDQAREAGRDIGYALQEEGWNEGISHWDHQKEMAELSRAFPEITFTLRGEGDDQGDLWVAYFRNGKFQEHSLEIIIPGIDESQWQEWKSEDEFNRAAWQAAFAEEEASDGQD